MHSDQAPGERSPATLTAKHLSSASPDWVSREDLETAIRAEVAAIHTLSQWGTGQCPAWVTTIVQAHCQILATLSDQLYRQHGVLQHHHRVGCGLQKVGTLSDSHLSVAAPGTRGDSPCNHTGIGYEVPSDAR